VRDVRFLVRARLRQGLVQATTIAGTGWSFGRTWTRNGVVRAQELLRLGQYAVEGERMTGEDRRQTLEALADAGRLFAQLPLIYRRLFGIQIIADRLALEGRNSELELVRSYDATWKEGITDALVISGWPGGGTTSFYASVLEVVAEGGSDILRIALDERFTDEAALCARMLAELAIPGNADDLDALADVILASDHDFPVVGIEGLEMLLIRTASGNGLLGSFLNFLSKTDAQVLWIATITRAAWLYLDRVEPTMCGLVRHLQLEPLSRKDLESVILGRHRRSGLRLVFDEHEFASPIMRRRMRRAASEADRQAILREDFFDRLARASGSSIVLALFYWLRSAYIGEDQHTLHVRPFAALNFAYLAELSAPHAFSLKALLEHGTLTAIEHERVVSVTREESRALFASLANLLLIERAHPVADRSARNPNPDDMPWRIRPLVLQPVLVMLRARNLTV
jgi:hypothetical protein